MAAQRGVRVMGILNVTPDSFSGDGVLDTGAAVARGLALHAAGAEIIDVGGESTRPGHLPVSAEVELARVIPVVRRLAAELPIPISIDTWKLEVGRAAVEAGARMLNDIWGLRRSPGLAALAAESGSELVVMHNQEGTEYPGDLIAAITAGLRESVAAALEAGVPAAHVIVDPGLGFGKSGLQNLEVLRRLEEISGLGQPLLVGASRKGYLGRFFGQEGHDRRWGTAASITAAVLRGAAIVRVHDVAEMTRVVRVAEALRR